MRIRGRSMNELAKLFRWITDLWSHNKILLVS